MFVIISKDRLLKLEAQVTRNTHEIAETKKAVNKIHRRDMVTRMSANEKRLIKDPKLTPHWFKVGGTI